MELELSAQLSQKLTPQAVANITLLSMAAQELAEFTSQQLQENPVLEQEEESPDSADSIRLGWTEPLMFNSPKVVTSDDDDAPDSMDRYGAVYDNTETLYSYLCSQLDAIDAPDRTIGTVKLLAAELDDSGYLDEAPETIAERLGVPNEVLQDALRVLWSLEPAGVGAHDLRQCLLLQLERADGDNKLAELIVRDHLGEMGSSSFNSIAVSLGVSIWSVYDACAQIKRLSPRPGVAFAGGEQPIYVYPDIIITKTKNGFELSLSNDFVPRIGINSYYARLSATTDDAQVRKYLSEKIKQARWVLNAIDNRRTMLLKFAHHIVENQMDFFGGEKELLKPMTQASMAALMEVHESTVSRIIKGKYLQCSKGVFPLSYFFSRASLSSDGSDVSAKTVQEMIRALIQTENRDKPFSDQQLMHLLCQKGVVVARRTVAKYREELGILNSAGRRAEYAGQR